MNTSHLLVKSESRRIIEFQSIFQQWLSPVLRIVAKSAMKRSIIGNHSVAIRNELNENISNFWLHL